MHYALYASAAYNFDEMLRLQKAIDGLAVFRRFMWRGDPEEEKKTSFSLVSLWLAIHHWRNGPVLVLEVASPKQGRARSRRLRSSNGFRRDEAYPQGCVFCAHNSFGLYGKSSH